VKSPPIVYVEGPSDGTVFTAAKFVNFYLDFILASIRSGQFFSFLFDIEIAWLQGSS